MRVFHDSIVLSIALDSDSLTFELEAVWIYDGDRLVRQETGKVIVEGLSTLLEDGLPVSQPTYQFDHGRVLKLELKDQQLYLLVEWERYSPNRTEVAEYTAVGSSVSWVPAPDV